jgi:hypothetical protein
VRGRGEHEGAEGLDEDGAGGDAVDVEVAVDGDFLAVFDGFAEAVDGGADLGEEEGVVVDGGGVEVGGGLFGGADVAVVEEVADERRIGGGREIAFGDAPAEAPAAWRAGAHGRGRDNGRQRIAFNH